MLRILMLKTVNAAVVHRFLVARRKRILPQRPADLDDDQQGHAKSSERATGLFSLKDFSRRLIDDRIAQATNEAPRDQEQQESAQNKT